MFFTSLRVDLGRLARLDRRLSIGEKAWGSKRARGKWAAVAAHFPLAP